MYDSDNNSGGTTELATARRVTPITEPIDRANVGAIQLKDSAGGVSFNNMIELMDFAKLMAVSQTAVPKHLRGNPGACLAVCIQAIEWRMSPFAVANKSYSVNDRLAYESGMYHAVACRRAPIKGRVRMEYTGKGDTRVCRVWAEMADGTGPVEYVSPEFGKIQPKNSPLWKNDPDQQLFYFAVRAWVRRHFPDVMAGIYTADELQDAGETVTQTPAGRSSRTMAAKFNAAAELPDTQLPEEELSERHSLQSSPAPVSGSDSDPAAPSAGGAAPDMGQPVAGGDEIDVSGADVEAPQADGIPPHGRSDVGWINDLILMHKGELTKQQAVKAFHSADVLPWEKLGQVRQDDKYRLLITGQFPWKR